MITGQRQNRDDLLKLADNEPVSLSLTAGLGEIGISELTMVAALEAERALVDVAIDLLPK